MSHGTARVYSCEELRCGDEIQAQFGGVVRFHGHVIELHRPMELLWAVDAIGERRIIEIKKYTVYRLNEVDDSRQYIRGTQETAPAPELANGIGMMPL
ncbi:hypothetical protein [Sinomonas terrae]|uniref:Uncharacterized protein n=1 Tax=Sinomonas terrae TaxID=2908838 RepID=A0ABS9U7E3_9MICC|nr:hypothetical protein [Sinomonas terrae]MCH6472451.1 hypothetical protein [Sinomonas terrae]